jgi:hypothetical protein
MQTEHGPALALHGFEHAQACLTQSAAAKLHAMLHRNDPQAALACARRYAEQ